MGNSAGGRVKISSAPAAGFAVSGLENMGRSASDPGGLKPMKVNFKDRGEKWEI
jgi:hypothetical protein